MLLVVCRPVILVAFGLDSKSSPTAMFAPLQQPILVDSIDPANTLLLPCSCHPNFRPTPSSGMTWVNRQLGWSKSIQSLQQKLVAKSYKVKLALSPVLVMISCAGPSQGPRAIPGLLISLQHHQRQAPAAHGHGIVSA